MVARVGIKLNISKKLFAASSIDLRFNFKTVFAVFSAPKFVTRSNRINACI